MSLLDALLLEPYDLSGGSTGPGEVWIAMRTDGVKGSGTQTDPWDGSTAAKFDALMQALPVNTRIHLGPGVFETRGYSDGEAGGWEPKSGQKILGSGTKMSSKPPQKSEDELWPRWDEFCRCRQDARNR